MFNFMNTKIRKNKKGFTLIELIVVIAILAILAAIAIPRLSGFQSSAKQKADVADAKTIATSVATLIADQKIAQTVTFTVDGSAGDVSGTNIEQANYHIKSYLQVVPKVKSEGTGTANFQVIVTNGDITVKSASATGDTFYPTYAVYVAPQN